MHKVRYRHECKFYINIGDYYILRSRVRPIMNVDKNAVKDGQYSVRSIYFDDYRDTALFEKKAGVDHREKFRIRFYNGDASFIRLEKKVKDKGLTAKFSVQISKEECLKIINGDIDWLKDSDENLLHELYIKMKTGLYKPKTIVDYTREAYIYPTGNVRITFDKSVRSGLFSINVFAPDLSTVEVLESNILILEVKFDKFIPDLILDIIQMGERRLGSVSKYALCRAFE